MNAVDISRFDGQTRRVTVTPGQAYFWLDRLKDHPEANKKRLSKSMEKRCVDRLVRMMLDGEWDETTHQGFLVGKDNLLLDGRHRCMAIVQSGVTVSVLITFDGTKSKASEVVADQDMALRSYAYSSSLPVQVVNVSRFLWAFAHHNSELPTRKQIEAVGQDLIGIWDKARSVQLAKKRGTNTGPVLSAFYLRIIENKSNAVEEAELLRIWKSLSEHDPKELPPLVYAFYRQRFIDHKISHEQECFVRLWRALDSFDRDRIGSLVFKNMAPTVASLRETVRRVLPQSV